MSTTHTTIPTRRRRGLIISLAVAAVLAITGVLTVGAVSGAWFTDTDQGNVSVSTGKVEVTLGDDHGSSDEFNLTYSNLVPGTSVDQTFYVRNDGTVPATAKVTGLTSFDLDGLTAADLVHFGVQVNGAAVTTSPVVLGSLSPGQVGTFVVRISLAGAAGNSLQDKVLTANGVVISLEQNH